MLFYDIIQQNFCPKYDPKRSILIMVVHRGRTYSVHRASPKSYSALPEDATSRPHALHALHALLLPSRTKAKISFLVNIASLILIPQGFFLACFLQLQAREALIYGCYKLLSFTMVSSSMIHSIPLKTDRGCRHPLLQLRHLRGTHSSAVSMR